MAKEKVKVKKQKLKICESFVFIVFTNYPFVKARLGYSNMFTYSQRVPVS